MHKLYFVKSEFGSAKPKKKKNKKNLYGKYPKEPEIHVFQQSHTNDRRTHTPNRQEKNTKRDEKISLALQFISNVYTSTLSAADARKSTML